MGKRVLRTVSDLRQSKAFADVHRDLIDQLERNGTFGDHYQDLVNDYMDMWVTKSLLARDIDEHGIMVTYDNGGGQKGRKKNESVEMRIKINAQMLKLLNELGIKPITTRPPIDGGGESGRSNPEDDHL
jgi:hypothetical protein